MDKASAAFLLAHNTPPDRWEALCTLLIVVGIFIGLLFIAGGLVRVICAINKYLERTRPMATRMPRGERRP